MSATTQLLKVGDREIAYQAPNGTGHGQGHPVLLIHGSSFNRHIWDAVGAELTDRHRPIWFDNPAHGESGGPAIETVDGLVDLAKQVHDALDLGPMVLIGHSLGGAVAQRYAVRYPDDLVALGLISTAPHFGLPDEVVEHWRSDPVSYREEEMSLIVAPQTSDEIRQGLFAIRDSTPHEGQLGDLAACATWDGQADYTSFTIPALVMTADHDVPVILESAAAWAAALTQGTLSTIPAASHMMTVEQPELSADAISGWVDSVDPA
jgi:pimeloyl-ACP methyl ester carboxylesterase